MSIDGAVPQIIPVMIHNAGVNPRSCACLDLERVNYLKKQVGSNDTYGVGCAAHNITGCLDNCSKDDQNKESCSYCHYKWCYISPDKCDLAFTNLTNTYKGLGISYPACGFDTIPDINELDPARNKTLRVAYLHNSGGYTGSFSAKGESLLEFDPYYGPLVEYVKKAAAEANFTLIQSTIPGYVHHDGSDNPFDRCMTAIQVGVVDICVGNYIQTVTRVLSLSAFQATTSPMIMVLDSNVEKVDYVYQSFKAFLRPFTKESWIAIFIMLTILGLLMLFHEYGVTGSAFPEKQNYIVRSKSSKENKIEYKDSSIVQYILLAPYMSMIGWVLNGNYSLTVVSWGAKLNLLALSFFFLTVWSAYNANLYSFVSQDVSNEQITSLEDVIAQPYLRVCTPRLSVDYINSVYPKLTNQIVRDEDGMPGFTGKNVRTRALENVISRAKKDVGTYECQLALTAEEDYWKLLAGGEHCNLKFVATDLHDVIFAFPFSDRIDQDFYIQLNNIKFSNWFDFTKESAKPANKCDSSPKPQTQQGMSIDSLSFIIIISFAFVGASCIVTIFRRFFDKERNSKLFRLEKHHPVYIHNQWNEEVLNTNMVDEQDIDGDVDDRGKIPILSSDS